MATTAITWMIEAFPEQLITIDELRSRMPGLRAPDRTQDASVAERQRVLRLLVKDILIGPEKITIRHRIPARGDGRASRQNDTGPDTDGDHRPGCPLRWGRGFPRCWPTSTCMLSTGPGPGVALASQSAMRMYASINPLTPGAVLCRAVLGGPRGG